MKLWAAVSRVWRWEFWPAWFFYLPLVPWIVVLSVRHRGLNVITAANPTIPLGGLVGESKHEIIASLPAKFAVPSGLIPAGDGSVRDAEHADADARLAVLDGLVTAGVVGFPMALKPNAGERGAGVRFVEDRAAAAAYLRQVTAPVLAQSLDPGPFEAGIFYVLCPKTGRGRIFSITDKVFSVVEGDGRSSVEDLIWQHPRYRMQAGVFLRRLRKRAAMVPAVGERVVLARAGNHSQGTMFLDGSRLWSEELEATIDTMARAAGVRFGRFDVRYSDPDELRAGLGLRAVELNGITSESTNIYDPRRGLLRAYAMLYRQWAILFRIGAAARRSGIRPAGHREMLTAVLSHNRRGSQQSMVSD
ncbi:MAG: carboxylate--amine ligase [Planctomycetota bacterium]